jgi:hypothetical protein
VSIIFGSLGHRAFRAIPERFPAKWIPVRVEENASKQGNRASVPIQSERKRLESRPFFLPDAGVGDRLTLAIDLHDTIPAATA